MATNQYEAAQSCLQKISVAHRLQLELYLDQVNPTGQALGRRSCRRCGEHRKETTSQSLVLDLSMVLAVPWQKNKSRQRFVQQAFPARLWSCHVMTSRLPITPCQCRLGLGNLTSRGRLTISFISSYSAKAARSCRSYEKRIPHHAFLKTTPAGTS